MSKLPLVTIIGRPNTGKSTLFNRLIGERRAIESEVPGTTRDHVASRIETEFMDYMLVDTGGMGPPARTKDRGLRTEDLDIHAQSMLAIEAADLILFTIDSREELTSSDRSVIAILRKKSRRLAPHQRKALGAGHVPIILVATKCDNPAKAEEVIAELHGLRIGNDILAVSAPHNFGIEELSETIIEQLKKLQFSKSEIRNQKSEIAPRIAIIGRPNVGKSSLINALMSEPQRAASPRLVSEIPGTTRDTTDTIIRHENEDFIFVDTAGLKRNAKTKEGIEHFAMLRAIQALENSDIAVLMIDGTGPISAQDKRIARMASDAGLGLIIVLNKIDLLTGEQREARAHEIADELQFCRFAPVLACSVTSRHGLPKLFSLIASVQRSRTRRISDRELHRWFGEVLGQRSAKALSTCKHLTQADGVPPTIVLFVRDPTNVKLSDLRYLERRLRETFGFEGTPVRWITKASSHSALSHPL